MNDQKKLFPEYLNQGSTGPAVALLQCLLRNDGWNDAIIVDSIYGEETAKGVKAMQEEYQIEADGHFGPQTREVLLRNGGLDVNSLPANIFTGETKAVGP